MSNIKNWINYWAFLCESEDDNTSNENFQIEDGVLKKYNGNDSEVVIPDSVTSIGNNAFINCKSLTSITIPDSVTSIGECAFTDCYSLTSITIPDSVTSIGDGAFGNCASLTSINIPIGVTSIGRQTFWNCESLTSITIPDSITSIGEYTFYKCELLKEITIPDSVTSIGDGAFMSCHRLRNVKLPKGIDYTYVGLEQKQIIQVVNPPKYKDRAPHVYKAPNGKRSKLTKKQWAQVRTPEFKKWFGDWEKDPENSSKMLDENGEPMVFFHGSSSWNPFAKDEQLVKYLQNQQTPSGRKDIISEEDNEDDSKLKKEIEKARKIFRAFTDDTIFLFDRNDAVNAHEYRKWVSHGTRISQSGKSNDTGVVLELFVNAKNPLVLDFKGYHHNDFNVLKAPLETIELFKKLEEVLELVRNKDNTSKSNSAILKHANGISRIIKDIRDGNYSKVSEKSRIVFDKIEDFKDELLNGDTIPSFKEIEAASTKYKTELMVELQTKLDKIIAELKKYDCVVCKNCQDMGKKALQTQYIVLNPNNVKSATKNSGEFSQDNDEIMKESIDISKDIGKKGSIKESDLIHPEQLFVEEYKKLDSLTEQGGYFDISKEFGNTKAFQVWKNYGRCMLGYEPPENGSRASGFHKTDKEKQFPKSVRGFVGWMQQIRKGKIRKTGGESRYPILAYSCGDSYIFGHWIKLPLINGVFIGCYVSSPNSIKLFQYMKNLFEYDNVVLEVTSDIANKLNKVNGLYTDGKPHSAKYNGNDVEKFIYATSKSTLNKALMFDKALNVANKFHN